MDMIVEQTPFSPQRGSRVGMEFKLLALPDFEAEHFPNIVCS